jgi:hypothetical protein
MRYLLNADEIIALTVLKGCTKKSIIKKFDALTKI